MSLVTGTPAGPKQQCNLVAVRKASRSLTTAAALITVAAFARGARAQAAPPVGQAPSYTSPPPGYAQPSPPPGYYTPQPGPWQGVVAEQPEAPPSPEQQRREAIEARTRIRRILSYIGTGVLVGGYVTGVMVSAADDFENGKKAMWIPVAGPWLTLANRHRPCEDRDTECWEGFRELFTVPFLVLDGVVQATGVILLATAIAIPDPQAAQPVTVSVAPYARPGAGGLVVAGAF